MLKDVCSLHLIETILCQVLCDSFSDLIHFQWKSNRRPRVARMIAFLEFLDSCIVPMACSVNILDSYPENLSYLCWSQVLYLMKPYHLFLLLNPFYFSLILRLLLSKEKISCMYSSGFGLLMIIGHAWHGHFTL